MACLCCAFPYDRPPSSACQVSCTRQAHEGSAKSPETCLGTGRCRYHFSIMIPRTFRLFLACGAVLASGCNLDHHAPLRSAELPPAGAHGPARQSALGRHRRARSGECLRRAERPAPALLRAAAPDPWLGPHSLTMDQLSGCGSGLRQQARASGRLRAAPRPRPRSAGPRRHWPRLVRGRAWQLAPGARRPKPSQANKSRPAPAPTSPTARPSVPARAKSSTPSQSASA